MILKEFSKKYGVPYGTVYESSFHVQVTPTIRHDRDYPEKELFEEVYKLEKARIDKHLRFVRKHEEIIERLRCVHP